VYQVGVDSLIIFGVFENQGLGRMHGVKQATENYTMRKIRNISSSPRSITWTEIIVEWKTTESIYSFSSKI
jgi:hypothetical protein